MKNIYIVWRMNDGGLMSDTFEVEGKVNHLSLQKKVRDSLIYNMKYDKYDFDRIISWQEEEPFTYEEKDEFWEKY